MAQKAVFLYRAAVDVNDGGKKATITQQFYHFNPACVDQDWYVSAELQPATNHRATAADAGASSKSVRAYLLSEPRIDAAQAAVDHHMLVILLTKERYLASY
ncbi:unnamed protein product [Clonostachys rosea]|uniref:Uncharacterized protein n=1 Tax=Bionectria ochroleuca TaxID=29856 RepID=A0ABY6U2A1_BIOOC|nr:unnamed protein product [Clonostachys rosea]